MVKKRIIITAEEEAIKKIFGLLGVILDVPFEYRIETVEPDPMDANVEHKKPTNLYWGSD